MRFSSVFTLALAAAPAYSATFPVTGPTGGVYPRLEVRTLHDNPDAWNLFLLALQKFYQTNQSQQLSYYGIAGIHGVPNVPWDGVQPNPAATGAGAVGYCPHSSILFPSWHRTYMALFDQIFQQQVQAVVKGWPAGAKKNTYATIAKTMRFPYFDWAAEPPNGLPSFPLILSAMQAVVETPTGNITITNPLFRYDFNPLNPSDMMYEPWSFWNRTLRYPVSNTSSSAWSQNDLATSSFQNNRINIRNQLYSVFTQCNQYPEFSNDASADSTAGCSISLEGIHDNIHNMMGGSNQGHMTYLWYAAFDPIFYLHHMNVDRLLAMWQTIYPGQWVTNQVAAATTYTIAIGTTQGLTSNLTPFHRDYYGNFWNSNQIQSWTRFGYTYPEFTHSDGSASAIKSYVNALYGPSATATAGSSKRTAMPNVPAAAPASTITEVPSLVEREDYSGDVMPTAAADLLSTPDGLERYHYTANIHVQRFGLGGPFAVYIFFGEFNEDPTTWQYDEALIGSHGVFAMTNMRHHNMSVAGAIPLTTALTQQVEKGALADMSTPNVVQFLQRNLQWRIATNDGIAVPASQVPGLEVSVVTSNCTLPATMYQFPKWSHWEELPEVTNGQAGGLQVGEALRRDMARAHRVAMFGEPEE